MGGASYYTHSSFAPPELETPAGILGAGNSATGGGREPAPKTHVSPARSAPEGNPIVGGRRATTEE